MLTLTKIVTKVKTQTNKFTKPQGLPWGFVFLTSNEMEKHINRL